MQYPEHEKMKQAKEKLGTEFIGEFLSWCWDNDITLCRWNDGEDEYLPVRQTVEQVLADYTEVNLTKIREEKDAMFEELRAQQGTT